MTPARRSLLRRSVAALAAVLIGLLPCVPTSAQVLPLPGVPLQPALGGATRTVEQAVEPVARTAAGARERTLRALVRRFPRELERDPRGAPIVRSVIVALTPSAAALEAARAAGFTVQGEQALDSLGERLVTLLAPRDLSTRRALDRLRALDPGGRYDFSHLYTESASAAPDPARVLVRSEVPAARQPPADAAPVIGMVDGGVATTHPSLRGSRVQAGGCAGQPVPSDHGTAVASLLVGRDGGFTGAAPGLTLEAIDIWCGGEATGGRIESLAVALSTLAGAQVAVVNLSLVGPPNLVLEAVVARVVARGILVVAAAGNDGPRAKPLYPAAYPGVIAVTAVDARERALLEAARGPHIRFAAPGADMKAANATGGYAAVRGTSFASPLVAGLLAARVRSGQTPVEAVASLAREARDLGNAGRDATYGEGLVGASLRQPPP